MENMRIMGIDLSLNGTGLAVVNERLEIFEKQVLKLNESPVADYPQLKGMDRLLYIVGKIQKMVEDHRPDIVIIEGYSFGSKGRAVFDLGELGGIVRYELTKSCIQYYEVPPTTLKKYITGSGVAKKDEMQAAVTKRYGKVLTDDNENDAFCLAAMFVELSLEDFSKLIGKRVKEKKVKRTKPAKSKT